jgi:pyruvate dehydrogenase E1 component
MGLGPIDAIYQARFNRYLQHRGIKDTSTSRSGASSGDGEMDEPESLGAIGVAAREELDNLIFVVNCNLQRLDGPVRGNGKIMQELESYFRGAGLERHQGRLGPAVGRPARQDVDGVLVNAMNTTPDGQFQTYSSRAAPTPASTSSGPTRGCSDGRAPVRRPDPHLPRGGHDYRKVYAGLRRGHPARRPADRDPGPHHQGLDPRQGTSRAATPPTR